MKFETIPKWLIAVVLILLLFIYGYSFFSGDSLTFWGKEFGIKKAGSGVGVRKILKNCQKYKVKIISPENGDNVEKSLKQLQEAEFSGLALKVSGSYKLIPEGYQIQLFVSDLGHPNYMPERVQINKVRKTWEGLVYLEKSNKFKQKITVALLGAEGIRLSDYHFKVGKETDQWVSLDELSNDTLVCGEVSVSTSQ